MCRKLKSLCVISWQRHSSATGPGWRGRVTEVWVAWKHKHTPDCHTPQTQHVMGLWNSSAIWNVLIALDLQHFGITSPIQMWHNREKPENSVWMLIVAPAPWNGMKAHEIKIHLLECYSMLLSLSLHEIYKYLKYIFLNELIAPILHIYNKQDKKINT